MKNEVCSFLKHPLTSLGPNSHEKYCIKIVLIIVLRCYFDSVTCANFSILSNFLV